MGSSLCSVVNVAAGSLMHSQVFSNPSRAKLYYPLFFRDVRSSRRLLFSVSA
jgi:hypothetical protein